MSWTFRVDTRGNVDGRTDRRTSGCKVRSLYHGKVGVTIMPHPMTCPTLPQAHISIIILLTTGWYITKFPAITRIVSINIAPRRHLLRPRVPTVILRVFQLPVHLRRSLVFLWVVIRPVLAWLAGTSDVHCPIVPPSSSHVTVI